MTFRSWIMEDKLALKQTCLIIYNRAFEEGETLRINSNCQFFSEEKDDIILLGIRISSNDIRITCTRFRLLFQYEYLHFSFLEL